MKGLHFMWLLYSLVCLLGWGCADLFYKRSAEGSFSHLKTAVWVGLVMGVCSLILMPFSGSSMSASGLFSAIVGYFPASLCYITSMIIGYFGLRYLELSIVSPVQNASGAFSAVYIMIYFIFTGRITDIASEFSLPDIIGTSLIVFGTIALAVFENHHTEKINSRSRFGAAALIFPLLYCLFDTIGTAADGIILASGTLSELEVLIVYGLTFFAVGLCAWIFLLIRENKPYNPFARTEQPRCFAALCEQFGQVFYVFAMASRPVLAAPIVASYCIVSVILSRIFLKEKLEKPRFISVCTVICGIVLLGIAEGLYAI